MSTQKDKRLEDLSDWVSQADAARLRGITRQAISRLVNRGRLTTLSVAGRRLVSRTDVLAFESSPTGRKKSK